MKFATLSHLMNEKNIEQIPKDWIHEKIIVSPELNVNGTHGYILALNLTAKQMMQLPREKVREMILEASLYAQEELGVEFIQLGALTTSVTSGGVWLAEQEEYKGFVNHGDSYTAAVTCQAVMKALSQQVKNPVS